MRKFFYFLLWPFNRLYDVFYCLCEEYEQKHGFLKVHEAKVVYVVIVYYTDHEKSICSVCDDLNLCEAYANELRKYGKFYKVDTVDYTLNRLYESFI